jgi:hypothetical protein
LSDRFNMTVGLLHQEPEDTELVVSLVDVRVRRPHGSTFYIRFARAGKDGSAEVVGVAGPYTEQTAKDLYAKWLAGHAESIARGEMIGIPTMMDVPADVQRALQESAKRGGGQ